MIFKITLILAFSIYPICHRDRSKEPLLAYTKVCESELYLPMAGSERTKRKEEWGGRNPERKPLLNELLAQVLWLWINTDIYSPII